jgi:hypothetical protein
MRTAGHFPEAFTVFSATTIPTLMAIGLVAGVAGGMLGIGGSLVMIPAMDALLGPDQHLYQAAAMIVNFFVVVPAVYQHHRAKAVDLPTVARLIPLAAVAVLAGVALSELAVFAGRNQAFLRGLFGVFLLLACVIESYQLWHPQRNGPPAHADGRSAGVLTWRRAACVAVPTGLAAGLLGVGGGVVAVPLQQRFMGASIRSAIANSATIIIATSLIGAAAKNYAYHVNHGEDLRPVVLALVLIPPAILGSTIGSRLTHRLPVMQVKLAFVGVLLIAAVRLIYDATTHALG